MQVPPRHASSTSAALHSAADSATCLAWSQHAQTAGKDGALPCSSGNKTSHFHVRKL